jgi:hypothetical protein
MNVNELEEMKMGANRSAVEGNVAANRKVRTRGGAPMAPSTEPITRHRDHAQSPSQARKAARKIIVTQAETDNRQARATGWLTEWQRSKVRRYIRRHPGTTLAQRTGVITARDTTP